MNADLEKTVGELGPGYRDVVARLRAAREVEPEKAPVLGRAGAAPWCAARSPISYLAAASLVAALALAVLYVMPRGGSTAAEVPLTVYTVAYAPTEEALEAIHATKSGTEGCYMRKAGDFAGARGPDFRQEEPGTPQ